MANENPSSAARQSLHAFPVGLISALAMILIVVHGLLAPTTFVVDKVTLGLLAVAALPFLATFVSSFKAGGVEFAFRDLSVYDQVVTFLDGIATKRQWTFFSPREGEESLGPAFKVLTDELLKGARPRFIEKLRVWLKSEEVNLRWFSAEIIGYHQLVELRRAVQRAPETTDINHSWEPWEMNCVWAASRFELPPYQRLCTFLLETQNSANQRWILQSFDQMIDAGLAPAESFAATIVAFARKYPNDAQLMTQQLPRIREMLPTA